MLKILMIAVLCFQSLYALDVEQEKKAIGERLHKFAEAVNKDKPEVYSTYWTEDAEFFTPITGELIEGKKDITEFMKKRTKEIKDRNLQFSFKPTKIEIPDVNTAIVEGVVEVTDKGKLIQRTARRIELAKVNGEWDLDMVSEIEVPPPPALYVHLKGLEWLVGNWEDNDEDVNITFATNWDKFKNFITQRFTMEVYGMDAIEGFQIIGWDPIEKKIRSWVYDSDGGFGTGLWSMKGNSWQVELDYTLSDGTKGTATNIYTKVNDNSYTFASINRKIGTEKLPDLEPVTVQRRK